MSASGREIARAVFHDLGTIAAAVTYCERVAMQRGRDAADYLAADDILLRARALWQDGRGCESECVRLAMVQP